MQILFFPLLILMPFVQDNIFMIGDKSFNCTSNMTFYMNKKYQPEYDKIDCLIAKNGSEGFFVISKSTSGSEMIIKGNAIIYLDDNTVITLYDKGKRDYVDMISTNVYNLTKSEIDKLQNSDISSVRFKVICTIGSSCTGPEVGDWTAHNQEKSYNDMFSGKFTKREKVKTSQIVKELYE